MVCEIAPHTLEIYHRVDADVTEHTRWSDAAAHQDRWTGVRPGREDDAPTLDHCATDQPNSAHAASLHLDPVHVGERTDGQVGPRPCRRQVGERRAHPYAVGHVAWQGADAGRQRVVEIAHPW